jgi:hypothetical protein
MQDRAYQHHKLIQIYLPADSKWLRCNHHPELFAMVEVNGFYVELRRVFNPALENRLAVVLSNK